MISSSLPSTLQLKLFPWSAPQLLPLQCQGNFHTLRAVVVPPHSCHTPRVYPCHRTLSWHHIQLQSAISSGTRLQSLYAEQARKFCEIAAAAIICICVSDNGPTSTVARILQYSICRKRIVCLRLNETAIRH